MPPLPPLQNGRLLPQPERVLHACLHRGVWHVLVHWEGISTAEATWEPLDGFRAEHPSFLLEDELFVEEGERCYGRQGVHAQEQTRWLRQSKIRAGAAHARRAARVCNGRTVLQQDRPK
jgi:hypothetical protein